MPRYAVQPAQHSGAASRRIQSFWHPREVLCRDSQRVTRQRARRVITRICLPRAKPLAARPAPFALTARGGKKRNPDAIARLDRRYPCASLLHAADALMPQHQRRERLLLQPTDEEIRMTDPRRLPSSPEYLPGPGSGTSYSVTTTGIFAAGNTTPRVIRPPAEES